MTELRSQLGRFIAPALLDRSEPEHLEPDSAFRRRRVVSFVTLLVGATLLGFSLSTKPGDQLFYVLTGALAATWIIGGFASGPLHLGRDARSRRPVTEGVGVGLASAAVFVLGALVVREIPSIAHVVATVLDHARYGSLSLVLLVTVVNGIAEEIFFRGALYAAIGRRRPIPICTVIYALATAASGNLMLVFAAVTLGAFWALQRRATGGILAPMISHVVWSVVMVLTLPPLFTGR